MGTPPIIEEPSDPERSLRRLGRGAREFLGHFVMVSRAVGSSHRNLEVLEQAWIKTIAYLAAVRLTLKGWRLRRTAMAHALMELRLKAAYIRTHARITEQSVWEFRPRDVFVIFSAKEAEGALFVIKGLRYLGIEPETALAVPPYRDLAQKIARPNPLLLFVAGDVPSSVYKRHDLFGDNYDIYIPLSGLAKRDIEAWLPLHYLLDATGHFPAAVGADPESDRFTLELREYFAFAASLVHVPPDSRGTRQSARAHFVD